MVTAYFVSVLDRMVSTTRRVVLASGAKVEFIKTLRLFFSASVTETDVCTPLSSPNPPPIAPIRAKSVRGLPSEVVSWIWKKLEMAAGANALASFKVSHGVFFWSQTGEGPIAGFDDGGSYE